MKLNLSLGTALIAAMLLSLLVGRIWVSPGEWLSGDLSSLIITQLRLPRICAGALIGAALGMSGAAMQGYLRNPLADPGLFGISACAALGAVASLFLGLSGGWWVLPLFALCGAMAGAALLAIVAGRSGSIILFTLTGVMLSSLAASLTALLINFAPTPFASGEIVTWLMGALTDRSWNEVVLAAPLVAAGVGLLLRTRPGLDALTLGDVAARSLGIDMVRLQVLMVGGLGLAVGSSVAIAGVIGFVGLMVPHLIRPFTGHRPSALLLPSALGGSLLVVLADTVVRALPSASEVRLGVMMSVLGAPFFLALLLKMRRELA